MGDMVCPDVADRSSLWCYLKSVQQQVGVAVLLQEHPIFVLEEFRTFREAIYVAVLRMRGVRPLALGVVRGSFRSDQKSNSAFA